MLTDDIQTYIIDTAYVIALEAEQGMVSPESSKVRLDFYGKIKTTLDQLEDEDVTSKIINLINSANEYESKCIS